MSEADDSEGLFPARVGDRLRAARDAQGLSLEEIAGRTRVPSRHLATIESGDLGRLPAAPYSAGFIKAYARVVGLDEAELSRAFRDELALSGDSDAASMSYAPADPSRVAPRALAWTAAVIAILLMGGYAVWRNSLGGGAETRAQLAAGTAPPEVAAPPTSALVGRAPAPASPAGSATPPATAAAPAGPVALTALAPVWIRVSEREGNRTLFMGELGLGQRYDIPPSAVDPVLRTGRAESLRVTVGFAEAPPLGPPATTLKDVSLRPEALFAPRPGASARNAPALPAALLDSGEATPPVSDTPRAGRP